MSERTPVAAGARIPGVPESNFYAALRYGEARGWNATLEASVLACIDRWVATRL